MQEASVVVRVLNACQVPEFKWHIIEDKVPFEIEGTGIKITPFNGEFSIALHSNPRSIHT